MEFMALFCPHHYSTITTKVGVIYHSSTDMTNYNSILIDIIDNIAIN